MGNCTEVNGSGGAQGTLSKEEFARRFKPLSERWQLHDKEGLALRHDTGKLLNEYLGPPTARLPRGQEAVVYVTEQLHIAESEVSRMRRFAHLFDSVDALLKKHPEATTWTAVKNLIPRLTPKGDQPKDGAEDGAASPPSARQTKPVQLSRLKHSMASLSSNIRAARKGLSELEKEELLQQFKEFAEAVSECLKIKVSVNEVSAENTLQAAPKE